MGLNRKTIYSALLFILGGQLVAFIIYFYSSKETFIPIFIASIIGFIVSYKKGYSKLNEDI